MFDFLIIGAGPGGYVAAIRAAQLGYKTCLIEREKLGGVCLNWGCIPTKALLRSAEVYHLIKNSEEYGIKIDGKISVDFSKVIARSRNVAQRLSDGIKTLMKRNKVEVIYGHATLLGRGMVNVIAQQTNSKLSAKHIILATGAKPREVPILPIDNKLIWNYKDAMVADVIPRRLLVVGAGAIGIEYASFYNEISSDVTVVEVGQRILPTEDEEIAVFAHNEFKKSGIKIMTNAQLLGVSKKSDESVIANIKDSTGKKYSMEFDRIISAVGVMPNTEDIGIENTKVKLTKSGHIITNEWMETDEKDLYAIGDITQPPFLAHKASHEAVVCIEKIADVAGVHAINKHNIPGCVYSSPQIASVGMTEKDAVEAGYKVNIGKFPFIGNGKAIAMGNSNGMIKTIFDSATGEIIGVHMVGCEVTELINSYTVAKTGELTDQDIINSIFPHPTLSEMLHESALASLSRAIHI